MYKVDYDSLNDSLFVYRAKPYKYEVSVELNNNIILDFDNKGELVAFEILK